jgi:hypothetical protein
MDEEASRLDIQLFADVLTDLYQLAAALPAGAGLRFMTVFDARQMIRQWLTTGTRTRWAWRQGFGTRRGFCLLPGQFGFRRGQIAGQRILEQVAFFTGKGFAPGAKAHPAQVGQFQREGLDLGLGGVKLGVAAGDLLARFRGVLLRLINEFLNGAENPFREFRSRVQSGQFSV